MKKVEGGFRPGEMNFVGSATNVGKSIFTDQQAHDEMWKQFVEVWEQESELMKKEKNESQ